MPESNRKGHVWVSVALGLLALVIVLWLAPSAVYQARGILLPAKHMRRAISPTAVVLMQSRPIAAKTMGYIHIEHHYPKSNPQAQQEAQNEIGQLAQRLAAKAGANAMIVTLFRLGGLPSSSYIYIFQATALYVPNLRTSPLNIPSLKIGN